MKTKALVVILLFMLILSACAPASRAISSVDNKLSVAPVALECTL